ncbi:MAG: polysaccharide pyruvyl transferase family protein [Acidobacteria bacterium]|nr:polysaccharide pyruvyl transferase family protein [Acidobacteriota bacterium]
MMDEVLEMWVSILIELSRLEWMLGGGQPWTPGTKLKLLFAGYNGTRNTGSDVRVEEMLRQVRRVLGAKNVHLSVMTQNFDYSRGYFGDATQVKLPDIFPPFLYSEVKKHHGVVACEGSMFKSKFANALTAMMIGSLGIASAQNKVSVGYGAEAGHMDGFLSAMCARYCRDSFVITRNEESRTVLRDLGVPAELGTDTAWTFEPHGLEYGTKTLADVGWDGRQPVLVICPINPFCWPVRASLTKGLAYGLTGAFRESHYRSIYFHNSGPKAEAQYKRYIIAFATAVDSFRREHDVFPILVAMERLDTAPCQALSAKLGGLPVFSSDKYDMYQLVSILRFSHLMISSRYHGIVTSMPGLVASAGVTMDERIRNLMRERGQPHLVLEADDPDLQPKLLNVLQYLWKHREEVVDAIGRTVVQNLKMMARMGRYFEDQVQRRYPEFPVRDGVLSWLDYLPALSPGLWKLIEEYDSSSQAETQPVRQPGS